ncbi:MAG: hypothetical protein UV74_C0001G0075 [Candidatus Woesebacteria bacterium GW2011_GWB1_43_14]|uniref:Transcobalamin-like C-terminal domain-containing protein n=1 Tax=Candidatus Woesebacteria bacterium GW2011_GWB1_43_14 TaxID=1618578 RepID=A0A0G1DM52_9BACT|nr:MAG: hypothetical protein UV51_C0002G0064 [Candidatus Woesebacteria bacterium GW2011_GWC1_42_9]KKS98965.1 MAG: hypothetical protein UV74_C0001G0075 [Candidatus Woesebacteria bacterium GW2011_GWB1_43_14]
MKARVYVLVASIVASSVFFLTLNRATTEDGQVQVLGEQKITLASVEISFGEGEVVSFEDQGLAGKNALEALELVTSKNNLELKVKNYDFGKMIEGLDGRENSDEKSWIYFVNGAAGSVAADQYILESGDKLEWKYIKPEF